MAGKSGAFGDALSNMRSSSSAEPKPEQRPEPAKPPAAQAEPVSEVNRLRDRSTSTRTEPFNQRVDVDVQNALYDFARKNNWTMNRTLREVARAFAVAQGDKDGAGL